MFKRIFALILVLWMVCLGSLSLAEDWRDQLRQAFGLQTEDQIPETPQLTEAPKKDEPITDPQGIVDYLEKYGELPDNFITKKEARALGWDSSYNYVGDVAPGKSIGGDRFGNYEGSLPDKKGRTWYECDVDYKGKKRGAKRLLYSSDGLYYYTEDHYNTFTQLYPEG